MQAVRLVLTQNSANYRKEEADRNKMTYPLPPYSTVIGAIHKACNFKTYHPMELSIQGSFQSMYREPYTDHCFLNSVMDDRGILVKVANESLLNRGYVKVATAKKSQGNSFRNGITIQVHNETLIEEYRTLLTNRDQLKQKKEAALEPIKQEKDSLKKRKASLDKKSQPYKDLIEEEKSLKVREKAMNEHIKSQEAELYSRPYSHFKSLTTSLKYYEILDDIKLIIHVSSDEATLNSILENAYSIKSIGRSEDFVQVEDVQLVTLSECDEEVKSKYSAYIPYEAIEEENVSLGSSSFEGGTKYYLNKNYEFLKDKKTRVFKKCKVIYASHYDVDEDSEAIWLDKTDQEKYIVCFA